MNTNEGFISRFTKLIKPKAHSGAPALEGPIQFQSNGELTLGVEIELQVIDKQTLNLTPRADEILAALANNKKIKPEVYLNMLEIVTDKCQDVHEVASDIGQSIDQLKGIEEQYGVVFSTTGTHPSAKYADCIVANNERYADLIDRNQWLTRRWSVYGMHLHIGMKSGDDCIRYNNFLLRFMPHILALTASSPFWQGEDTGLSSCRPTVFESLPTSGTPYFVKDWAEFERLCNTLVRSKSIKSLKDLWWDIRPSPGYGTLEIRICDGLATKAGAIAVVAFIHALCHWFKDHGDWIDQVPLPPRWILRENKWRVIRHGLEADIIMNAEGQIKSVRQDIRDWVEKLSVYIHTLGYQDYIATALAILEKGTSSERQRAVFRRDNSLDAVIRHNINEFNKGSPDWSVMTGASNPVGQA